MNILEKLLDNIIELFIDMIENRKPRFAVFLLILFVLHWHYITVMLCIEGILISSVFLFTCALAYRMRFEEDVIFRHKSIKVNWKKEGF